MRQPAGDSTQRCVDQLLRPGVFSINHFLVDSHDKARTQIKKGTEEPTPYVYLSKRKNSQDRPIIEALLSDQDITSSTGYIEISDDGLRPDRSWGYHAAHSFKRDLAGLTSRLEYLEGLGVTAIWITPPFVNTPTLGDGTVAMILDVTGLIRLAHAGVGHAAASVDNSTGTITARPTLN